MLNSQEKLSCQIETHGKSTQENLAQHLDSVEVNIADQVAQKSHHFFHVSFLTLFYMTFERKKMCPSLLPPKGQVEP